MQMSIREPGRKNPRSVCTCLGCFDEAPARLASLLPQWGVTKDEIPSVTARLMRDLEAKWSPVGEAQRMREVLLRLWERADHPDVRMELLMAAEAMRQLAEQGGRSAEYVVLGDGDTTDPGPQADNDRG